MNLELESSSTTKTVWVPPLASQLGDIPGYEILNFIAHGGMGAVYFARQKSENRVVAVKIARPKKWRGRTYAALIAHEAFVMSKLDHKNIVKVYDTGRSDDLVWMAMEFVKGITVRHLLRTRPISPFFTLSLSKQLCHALRHAHTHGVIHHDLKPGNVLIDTNNQAKIIDFGIAKVRDFSYTITRPGEMLGTPHYMAPEQLLHPRDCDYRIDIYALGVMMYQLITGELPFADNEQKEALPPSHYVNVGTEVDRIILRCLERNPGDRWQSAGDLLMQLHNLKMSDLKPKRPSYSIPTANSQSFESQSNDTEIISGTTSHHPQC
jgi:serine/threonine protein kinase